MYFQTLYLIRTARRLAPSQRVEMILGSVREVLDGHNLALWEQRRELELRKSKQRGGSAKLAYSLGNTLSAGRRTVSSISRRAQVICEGSELPTQVTLRTVGRVALSLHR